MTVGGMHQIAPKLRRNIGSHWLERGCESAIYLPESNIGPHWAAVLYAIVASRRDVRNSAVLFIPKISSQLPISSHGLICMMWRWKATYESVSAERDGQVNLGVSKSASQVNMGSKRDKNLHYQRCSRLARKYHWADGTLWDNWDCRNWHQLRYNHCSNRSR